MNAFLDSALDQNARRRLTAIGGTDVLIGLPTYKNSRTIGNVVGALAAGMVDHFPDKKAHILVSDGGSTDETLDVARSVALPPQISLSVAAYQGLTGKGSAIRAIMEAASTMDARACAIVDADVRSITPAWIERLVGPVIADEADYVCPVYTRDRHEVTINDLIGFPLTRTLYGLDIRQPLGGEVAMAPVAWKTFSSKDVWETDVARFGIHPWMVIQAINSGWRLYQAPLGTKTHDYKDPTVGFEPKFLQIVGTLFRMMTFYRRIWPEIDEVRAVPEWGSRKHLDPEPVPTTRQTLWDGFQKGLKRYRRNLSQILDEDQQAVVADLASGDLERFPADDWARIVMAFAVVYNRGEGDPDKVALSLLPLYYARKALLLRQLEGQPWTAVEKAIREQANAFDKARPYLLERWSNYVPWQAPIG
jgi:glycosyltransferase involved in cell wall biosynthesis